MKCKVDWPLLYKRQRDLKHKLASDCGCPSCLHTVKAMKNTDKVMKANEENATHKRKNETL